jgi:hypothetical protein
MRVPALLRSPWALPLMFAVSSASWLAHATYHQIPPRLNDGVVWIYVTALCAEPGDASDCHSTGPGSGRIFDTMEACAAHMDADLSRVANPRLMGSCLPRPEA